MAFLDTKKTTLILLALGLSTLIGSLNTMIFNVALPTMVTYFNAPLSTVQWLTSGYMLAAGMIIPAAGYLGDRFGYKRLLTVILLSILALSLAGAFAWCIEVLIVIRFFVQYRKQTVTSRRCNTTDYSEHGLFRRRNINTRQAPRIPLP